MHVHNSQLGRSVPQLPKGSLAIPRRYERAEDLTETEVQIISRGLTVGLGIRILCSTSHYSPPRTPLRVPH